MSFVHNTAAPGFSQSHDPFADLAEHDNDADALNFDDTYDGLGDQLDETDDAFNDDTFGGDDAGPTPAPVGKDFDFFGQTAQVAGAIEEEHVRFHRGQPPPRAAVAPSQNYDTGYSYQAAPKPTRSGYEKYHQPEPASDLQIDASIWGVAPKKSFTPAAAPQAQPAPPAAPTAAAQPPNTGRKMMSLEEVEAAMRARSKPATSAAQPPQPQSQPQPVFSAPEPQLPPQPVQYPHQESADYRQPPGLQSNDAHRFGQQGGPHGHPVTILQRPSKHTPPVGPGVASPMPQQQQQQQQGSPMVAPTQILQNPNRMPGDASRVGLPTHPLHRSQDSFSRQSQVLSQQSPQLPQLSEEDKAAYLEAEARRAKRNHKIFVLSKDNGLMTPQDKSFITRIQLQQLVTAIGDPSEHDTDAVLAEDFYYQVLSSLRVGQRPHPNQPLNNFAQTYLYQTGSRHAGLRRHGRGPENHMQRMEQQVQRAVEAARNKPKNKQLVIEGSLGKISFSNTKTPKPLLNLKRTESGDANRPSSAHRPQTVTKTTDKKATLKNIEGVYMALMKMEDLTRKMPPPSPNGVPPSPEFVERQAELQTLNERLWDDLKVHEPIGATVVHPFIAFLSYPKGKKAIPRVFRFLTHEQRTTILTIIVIHLDQLDVVRDTQVHTGERVSLNAATRESIELFTMAVTPSLLQVLIDSELPIITAVLGLMIQNLNIDKVARTRVGISMFTMILSRAELIKQALTSEDSSWQQW